jgi:TfoX/Sxy family transcriptional regulator of competence genes
MATRQETVDYILDQLASLNGVHARKMFGEYELARKVLARYLARLLRDYLLRGILVA